MVFNTMNRFIKIIRTIRNNWKKSTFGAVALSYGVHYAKEKNDNDNLMTQYCEEAAVFGNETIPVGSKLRKVTVIINPSANKRKAVKNFEKYCAPILHLAGICVNIVETTKEGHARTIAEKLDEATDAVIVAGGDGTINEVITGLLRRNHGSSHINDIPIGILPLGRKNNIISSFIENSNVGIVQMMAESALAVVKSQTKLVDVMKIELLQESEENTRKPVYSLGKIHWGAYRDAEAREDKYWYFGALRSYATYLFSGLKSEKHGICWNCKANILYKLPCSGCSKCYGNIQNIHPPNNQKSRRWWHSFVPKQTTAVAPSGKSFLDYKKINNEECGIQHDKTISTIDFTLTTNPKKNRKEETTSYLEVSFGPETMTYTDFVTEGWKRVNGKIGDPQERLEVQEITIFPAQEDNTTEKPEYWMSIDKEEYEVRPIRVALLPKRVKVFTLV